MSILATHAQAAPLSAAHRKGDFTLIAALQKHPACAAPSASAPALPHGMRALCGKIDQHRFEPAPLTALPPSDALLAAITRSADPAVLRAALQGEDPNQRRGPYGITALSMAAGVGNWAAVTTLLDAGADIHLASGTPEEWPVGSALLRGHAVIACQLILRGATVPPPAAHTTYLLPMAALTPNADDAVAIVGFLLDHGYPITATTGPLDETALHMAVATGHIRLAAYLMGRGANPRQPDAKGRTPLAAAQHAGNSAMLKVLRKR